jgi:hypothetical protein
MSVTNKTALKVYVKEEHVRFDESVHVHTARGYRVHDAEKEPFVRFGDIPILGDLRPELAEIKKGLVYEISFETEKELELGWFHLDRGRTIGMLKKIENTYHLMVESFSLSKLRQTADNIRFGHIVPTKVVAQ